MTNKRGRKEHFIWANFEKQEFCKSKKRYSCICKHCDLHFHDGRVSILTQHIANNCVKAPPQMVIQAKLQNEMNNVSQSDNEDAEETVTPLKKKNGHKAQRLLDNFFESTPLSTGKQRELEKELGNFILSTNSAFSIVEDHYFLRYMYIHLSPFECV
jgi:hypothetical protein